MRCTPDTTPTEEFWKWNGLDVHLDRLAVPDAKFKVIVLHGAGAYGRVMATLAAVICAPSRLRNRVARFAGLRAHH